MPIGIMINALSVLLGGIFGALGGKKMSANFKDGLNMAFGVCSMTMGIYAIAPMKKHGSRDFCHYYRDWLRLIDSLR